MVFQLNRMQNGKYSEAGQLRGTFLPQYWILLKHYLKKHPQNTKSPKPHPAQPTTSNNKTQTSTLSQIHFHSSTHLEDQEKNVTVNSVLCL